MKVKYVRTSNPKLRRRLPVFDYKNTEPIFDPILFEKIKRVWVKHKSPLDYMDYWELKKAGLDIKKVFSCLKAYHKMYPDHIRFMVNRSGYNVYFKIVTRKEVKNNEAD